MGVFLLQSKVDSAGRTTVTGADACVVVAHNATDAKAMAKAQFTGVSPSSWDNGSCVEISEPSDVEGFTMVCSVLDPDNGTVADVSVGGRPGQSLDDLAVDCAAELNKCKSIHGAAYNSLEHVLTVASPLGGDVLGHAKVNCAVYPPDATAGNASGIPGCVKAVVDGGEPADPLTVVLAGVGYTLPCKVIAFGSGS